MLDLTVQLARMVEELEALYPPLAGEPRYNAPTGEPYRAFMVHAIRLPPLDTFNADERHVAVLPGPSDAEIVRALRQLIDAQFVSVPAGSNLYWRLKPEAAIFDIYEKSFDTNRPVVAATRVSVRCRLMISREPAKVLAASDVADEPGFH